MEGVLSPLIVAFGDVRVVSVLNGEKKLRDKLSRATRQAVNAQAALSQARAALENARRSARKAELGDRKKRGGVGATQTAEVAMPSVRAHEHECARCELLCKTIEATRIALAEQAQEESASATAALTKMHRKLAPRLHPDRAGDGEEARFRFEQLQTSAAILRCPELRMKFVEDAYSMSQVGAVIDFEAWALANSKRLNGGEEAASKSQFRKQRGEARVLRIEAEAAQKPPRLPILLRLEHDERGHRAHLEVCLSSALCGKLRRLELERERRDAACRAVVERIAAADSVWEAGGALSRACVSVTLEGYGAWAVRMRSVCGSCAEAPDDCSGWSDVCVFDYEDPSVERRERKLAACRYDSQEKLRKLRKASVVASTTDDADKARVLESLRAHMRNALESAQVLSTELGDDKESHECAGTAEELAKDDDNDLREIGTALLEANALIDPIEKSIARRARMLAAKRFDGVVQARRDDGSLAAWLDEVTLDELTCIGGSSNRLFQSLTSSPALSPCVREGLQRRHDLFSAKELKFFDGAAEPKRRAHKSGRADLCSIPEPEEVACDATKAAAAAEREERRRRSEEVLERAKQQKKADAARHDAGAASNLRLRDENRHELRLALAKLSSLGGMVTLKHTGVGQLNGEAATILPDEEQDGADGKLAIMLVADSKHFSNRGTHDNRTKRVRPTSCAESPVLSMLYDEILDDLVGFMTRRIAHNNLKAVHEQEAAADAAVRAVSVQDKNDPTMPKIADERAAQHTERVDPSTPRKLNPKALAFIPPTSPDSVLAPFGELFPEQPGCDVRAQKAVALINAALAKRALEKEQQRSEIEPYEQAIVCPRWGSWYEMSVAEAELREKTQQQD